jgi:hypothetical protein
VSGSPWKSRVGFGQADVGRLFQGLGAVRRVDPRGRTIALDDGQDYLVPLTVLADPGVLGEGTILRLRLDIDGCRNYVKYLQVRLWRPPGS